MISFPLRSSCCMKGKFLGDRGYSYWPLWWYGDQDKLNDFAGNCMLSVSGAYFDGNGYYFDGTNDYLIDAGGRKVLQGGTMGTWSSIILTDGEVPPEGSIQGTGTKLYLNTSGTTPKITGKIILYPYYCPNLTCLCCYGNSISILDVSNLTSLTSLYCASNSISILDVSNLTLLTHLHCYNNSISILDVSSLTSLTYLYCTGNSISVLDVSSLTSLTYLHCYGNSISVLDVSSLTSLTTLYCQNNSISVLDVSNLTSLTHLYCTGNSISVLDVSSLTSLTTLYCASNSMNQAMVDTVLCDMEAHGTSNGTLNISNNAVPSGAGLTCRDDLVLRGWTVTVDS